MLSRLRGEDEDREEEGSHENAVDCTHCHKEDFREESGRQANCHEEAESQAQRQTSRRCCCQWWRWFQRQRHSGGEVVGRSGRWISQSEAVVGCIGVEEGGSRRKDPSLHWAERGVFLSSVATSPLVLHSRSPLLFVSQSDHRCTSPNLASRHPSNACTGT